MLNRVFLKENVLVEARKRISLIFDNFETIVVSVSSGKDSTALYWLVVQEAEKRKRLINVFFLDQEVEYASTSVLIEKMMSHPNVIPLWYQVSLKMTNATSFEKDMLNSWGEGEEWIREKHPLAIHSISEKYPDRFYSFMEWVEKKYENAAFFVGLRSDESLNRLRAVIKNPGWGDILWSTKAKRGKGTYRFYPLYDWTMGDVWKFIYENNLPYNVIYDKMFKANKNYYKTMRVSNLIHEKSFKCLSDLQVYEPDTHNKLIKRVSGMHVASIYAHQSMFNADVLPKKFKTWLEFRNYLLETTPLKNKGKFIARFEKQPKEESMYRKHVRQLMLNDYENNLAIKTKFSRKKEDLSKWWDIL